MPPDLLTTRSARVKAARRLERRASRAETSRFLAEGPQAVREALAADCVEEVFADPSATGAAHDELSDTARDRGVPWRAVDAGALASLSGTVSPQGPVAVCRTVHRPLEHLLQRPDRPDGRPRLVVVCADVRDPGNAGTVLRCADAAGADLVVLAGTSVDAYNPKTVRASAGSLFHLPLALEADAAAVVALLARHGLRVLAATGSGEADLDDLADDGTLRAPTAWLFGNEAHGLPDAIAASADARVRIPIHGRAESLNLATAAAVCLYASARAQRAGVEVAAKD